MEYLIEGEDVNPVAIERQLGLARKDVRSVTISAEGWVVPDIALSIDTPQNRQKIRELMARNGKIWGKKKG